MRQDEMRREPKPEGKVRKYLTFRCGNEHFAIPVGSVREIIGIPEITPVPRTDVHVKGVINLRGRVIPVIDLRVKLRLEARDYDKRSCIVVIQPANGQDGSSIGLAVDTVCDIVAIFESEIESIREVSGGLVSAQYVEGLAKVRGSLKIVLDVAAIIEREESARLGAGKGMERSVA